MTAVLRDGCRDPPSWSGRGRPAGPAAVGSGAQLRAAWPTRRAEASVTRRVAHHPRSWRTGRASDGRRVTAPPPRPVMRVPSTTVVRVPNAVRGFGEHRTMCETSDGVIRTTAALRSEGRSRRAIARETCAASSRCVAGCTPHRTPAPLPSTRRRTAGVSRASPQPDTSGCGCSTRARWRMSGCVAAAIGTTAIEKEPCTCVEHWDDDREPDSFALPPVPRILRQILFCRGVEEFFVVLESALRLKLDRRCGHDLAGRAHQRGRPCGDRVRPRRRRQRTGVADPLAAAGARASGADAGRHPRHRAGRSSHRRAAGRRSRRAANHATPSIDTRTCVATRTPRCGAT